MAKSSFVLKALKILGLKDIQKLFEVLLVKQAPLKKAAGEELIGWDEAIDNSFQKAPKEEAKILSFPKKTIQDMATLEPEAPATDEPTPNLLTSDLILWQREISRDAGENSGKLDAFKGYKKANEMYVVKTKTVEGKDKIHFASTNGVLVDKKQA